jgi:two-component system phosphate regulon response regulator PhoB
MGEPLVLIAEDDPDLGDLLQITLEHRGWRTTVVTDGTEVVDACLQHDPDLVLLDLTLPGLPGVEVLRTLRGHGDLQGLPVLVITGMSRESGVDEALAAGATDWLGKPFSPSALTTRVELLLSHVSP